VSYMTGTKRAEHRPPKYWCHTGHAFVLPPTTEKWRLTQTQLPDRQRTARTATWSSTPLSRKTSPSLRPVVSSCRLRISSVRPTVSPRTRILTRTHTAVIDRTATFVVKSANPTHFEDRIRENQRQDPKFSFLHPADPYHAYYRDRLEKVAKGEVDDEDTPKEGKEPTDQPVEKPVVDMGEEPPVPQFILDWPNISTVDLCVCSPRAFILRI